MKYELHGTYYTIDEVVKKSNVAYSIVCRRLKALKMKPLNIGATKLLTQEQYDDLLAYCNSISSNEEDLLTFSGAAKLMDVSLYQVRRLIAHGLPVYNSRGKPCRVKASHIEAVIATKLIQKPATDWVAVVAALREQGII